ncbi:MAG: hypothetical protein LBU88_09400 [Treponema sp.]|jgi:hypothetical protein|nr:hypothetical protein [Treponema sp.]
MSEISRNKEYEELIFSIQELETELASLVYERDNLLYHTCPQIETEYMLKIGKLECSIFEYQCKILRVKRKIEIIQSFLNKEQSYNIDEIEKQLDKEQQEYSEKLKEKQQRIEEARFRKSNYGTQLTDEESIEIKKLYTQIVKKLHPDLNPDTTEEQHGQFIDAVNAYKNADLSEMRIIFLLLEKTTIKNTSNSLDKLNERKEKLSYEKKYLISDIQSIKTKFPYNVKELLQNNDLLQQKIEELSDALTEYQNQYLDIEKRLLSMVK